MGSPLVLSHKKHKNLYRSKIKLLSPAKLNLYLNILGKYPGGFHEIESIVERISLCDEISITPQENPKITITSNIKSLESKDNLCVKAASLIKKKYGIKCGFNIHLKKKIPVGAGLGGGSSNGATVLIGITKLLKLNLKKEALYRMGSVLGSDVNFFLCEGSFGLVTGRGEKVIALRGKKLKHLIIWPKKFLSTKQVYNKNKAKLTKFFNGVNIIKYALKKGDIRFLKSGIFNALESSAIALCQDLSKVINTLRKNNIDCYVTGSGSALYTVSDTISARRIKNLLRRKLPVFTAQTF